MNYTILGKPITASAGQRIVMIPKFKGSSEKRPAILRSAEALTWTKSAVIQLKAQKQGPMIEGPVEVQMNVHREINSGDVDNYAKIALDAMTDAGVWRDDKLVMKLTVEKFVDPKNPRIEVTVTERAHTGILFPHELPS